MSPPAATRTALWPAFVTIAAIAAAGYLFLRVEAQWEVAALAIGSIAVLLLTGRTGWAARVSAAWSVRPAPLAATSTVAALALIALFGEDHFALLMIATVLLYGVACLGLTIQFGYAGVVNFAGAAFFGVGGYTAAVLAAHTGLPHLLILALGGVFAGVLGSLLVLPLLRTRGHYAALITVAFAILFKTFLEVNDALGGPQGLKVPGLRILGWSFNDNLELAGGVELSFYLGYALLCLALTVAAYVLVRRLERSWLGLSLDAVRIDETAAAVFGFEVARWKIFAFTLGNVLAGIAGALYAMMTGFVAPASFTLAESLIMVSIVILGGMGNPVGVLAAAALALVLPEKLQAIQEYRFLLFSVFVILVLLFRPEGLLPRRLRAYVPGWGRALPAAGHNGSRSEPA
jgi:ABC-type branched-subunit amino acid transport system permease subunit